MNVNDICNNLKLYYDSRILKKSSPLIQAVFIDSATKAAKNAGNTTLTTLIKNYYNPMMPIVERLSGPYNIRLLTSNKYKKNVYIFGEVHGTEKNCKEFGFTKSQAVSTYFQQLALSTDVFIDLYFEVSEHDQYGGDDEGSGFLNRMRGLFSSCTTRKNCPYNTLRTHYTDLRETANLEIRQLRDIIEYGGDVERAKAIARKISMMTKEQFSNYLYQSILDVIQVQKELRRSTESLKIEAFIRENIKKIATERWIYIQKLTENYAAGVTTVTTDILTDYSFLKNIIIKLQTPIMDIYLLSRIFKVFNVGEKTFQPVEPHNIIIYAGAIHSNTYTEFLRDKMGFIQHLEINEEKWEDQTRCLDMRTVSQPLFSTTPIY